MLRMIAEVYHLQGGIRPNRSVLFGSFIDALLERERLAQRTNSLDPAVEIDLLSDVALGIQREHGGGTRVPTGWVEKRLNGRLRALGRTIEYSAAQALALARNATLLEQSPDGSIRFTHQLLQEYFAALALKRRPSSDGLLREASRYPLWDEVLVLLAGLLEDTEPLIRRLLPIDPALAARCFHAAESKPPLRIATKLISTLAKIIQNPPPGEKWSSVRAFADLATLDTLPLLVPLLSHADVQLSNAASGAIASLGEAALPSLMPLFDNPDANTRLSARGTILSVATAKEVPLIARVLVENPICRESAVQALWRFPPEAVRPHIQPLLSSRDSEIRRSALRVVREFKDASAGPLVLPLLSDCDPKTRRLTIEVIGFLRVEAAIPELMRLMDDQDPQIRAAAAEALGLLKQETAAPKILELFRSGDDQVRRAAANAVVQLGAEAVLPHLGRLVRQGTVEKLMAADVLGSIGTEACIPQLRTLIVDEDDSVRRKAFWALTSVKPLPVPELLPALEDPQLREIVAVALLAVVPERVVPVLIQLLRSHDMMQRWRAVQALSSIPARSVVSHLLPLLTDKDQWVRVIAAEILGILDAKVAIPQLLPILSSRDPTDRRGAAFALGKMRMQQAIPHLVPLLKDPHGGARMAAAESLLAMTDDLVPEIIPMLADPFAQIAQLAAGLLKKYAREQDLARLAELLKHDRAEVRESSGAVIAAVRRRLNLPKDYKIKAAAKRPKHRARGQRPFA